MANKLLTERGASHVGQQWPRNFVKRTDSLKTRFNRPYNRQRALCEDPAAIQAWFELVARTKATYSICDKDTFNFNETSFLIGKISSQLVITSLERRSRLKAIQPSNREQVIAIYRINTTRQAISLFIIFASQYYLFTQYKGNNILGNQAIGLSDNGQTTNKLSITQLQYFIKYIVKRRVGARQLLILNSYKSYNSLKFQEIYKENNIYTLYILAYSSYLLQPLNVGYFSPLKRAYGRQVESLIRDYINYITKLKFLLAFYTTYNQLITKGNIYVSFRGTSLVLYNLEVVILKLNIKLYTPSLVALLEAIQEAKTLSNQRELEA